VSKETAFYPRLKALTDEWMDLFGYWAPTEVTDTQEEYRAVRETAGLMDFTMLRKVDLDGDGALDLVNSIVTRDVSALTPGRIAYGALTDENGKMVDDCTTMMRAADRVRFCGANDRDYEIFTAAAEGTGIAVSELTDAMPHLCLQGPRSREILQGLTDADLSNAAFPYYTFREDVEIAGIPIFMTRLGYTDRNGRARPLPHRGRLHHRRRRVRPDGLAVRVRARLVGRPRQGRLPGEGESRPRP
jgi:aminomethyltransferase